MMINRREKRLYRKLRGSLIHGNNTKVDKLISNSEHTLKEFEKDYMDLIVDAKLTKISIIKSDDNDYRIDFTLSNRTMNITYIALSATFKRYGKLERYSVKRDYMFLDEKLRDITLPISIDVLLDKTKEYFSEISNIYEIDDATEDEINTGKIINALCEHFCERILLKKKK